MTQSNQSIFFASGYATVEQPGIQTFSFDETSGEIKQVGSFTGINTPSFIIAHPNRHWLYAVSETGQGSHGVSGAVWAFDATKITLQYKESYANKSGSGKDGAGFDLDGGVTNSVMQNNYSPV